ncbi:hypothetical protein CWI38_1055p0020 [Hamiltosporidium tvaerminnensis]|uniref:Uncharacterized protein n=1 Tax=Hamiltosporidium tvaerminnensis TaxID=1176355 RepID=A0A4Q9LT23_9MICR|nr:hypothetical protein CWI38_1055p0020 [Hamiltosporidium tvaerminnensis]
MNIGKFFSMLAIWCIGIVGIVALLGVPLKRKSSLVSHDSDIGSIESNLTDIKSLLVRLDSLEQEIASLKAIMNGEGNRNMRHEIGTKIDLDTKFTDDEKKAEEIHKRLDDEKKEEEIRRDEEHWRNEHNKSNNNSDNGVNSKANLINTEILENNEEGKSKLPPNEKGEMNEYDPKQFEFYKNYYRNFGYDFLGPGKLVPLINENSTNSISFTAHSTQNDTNIHDDSNLAFLENKKEQRQDDKNADKREENLVLLSSKKDKKNNGSNEHEVETENISMTNDKDKPSGEFLSARRDFHGHEALNDSDLAHMQEIDNHEPSLANPGISDGISGITVKNPVSSLKLHVFKPNENEKALHKLSIMQDFPFNIGEMFSSAMKNMINHRKEVENGMNNNEKPKIPVTQPNKPFLPDKIKNVLKTKDLDEKNENLSLQMIPTKSEFDKKDEPMLNQQSFESPPSLSKTEEFPSLKKENKDGLAESKIVLKDDLNFKIAEVSPNSLESLQPGIKSEALSNTQSPDQTLKVKSTNESSSVEVPNEKNTVQDLELGNQVAKSFDHVNNFSIIQSKNSTNGEKGALIILKESDHKSSKPNLPKADTITENEHKSSIETKVLPTLPKNEIPQIEKTTTNIDLQKEFQINELPEPVSLLSSDKKEEEKPPKPQVNTNDNTPSLPKEFIQKANEAEQKIFTTSSTGISNKTNSDIKTTSFSPPNHLEILKNVLSDISRPNVSEIQPLADSSDSSDNQDDFIPPKIIPVIKPHSNPKKNSLHQLNHKKSKEGTKSEKKSKFSSSNL